MYALINFLMIFGLISVLLLLAGMAWNPYAIDEMKTWWPRIKIFLKYYLIIIKCRFLVWYQQRTQK